MLRACVLDGSGAVSVCHRQASSKLENFKNEKDFLFLFFNTGTNEGVGQVLSCMVPWELMKSNTVPARIGIVGGTVSESFKWALNHSGLFLKLQLYSAM